MKLIKRLIDFRLLLIGVFLVMSCNTLRPFLLSESDEITMGNKFAAQITADSVNYPHYHGSASVSKYIDSIGQLIGNVQKDWKSSSLKFTFTLVKNDTMINAFAVPGGHVYLYTGLLLAAENESQVAGVMAHEIAHVVKHHSANILIKQNMIGLLNEVIFGNDSSSIRAVSQILEGLVFLRFSRDNEYEADSCAVAYTTAANMNPKGMSQFLGILKKEYGANSTRILEPVETAVSTHPPVSQRITEVDGIIQRSKADTLISLKSTEYLAIRNLVK